jgi:hypothetical protein
MAAAIGISADALRRFAEQGLVPGPAKLNRKVHLWNVAAVKAAVEKLRGGPDAA